MGNVHDLLETVDYITAFTGMHQFAEFTAEDVGTVDSGLNSMVLANNNDYAEAIPIYRRALALKPDIMAARHNLGSALHTLKRFGESLHVLPQSVSMHACVRVLQILAHYYQFQC